MNGIDIPRLFQDILAAATGAARGHAQDLEQFLAAQAKLIADGTAQIAADRLQKRITEDDVKFAFEQIRNAAATAALAVEVTLKAAAQDAINAALQVAAAAVNKAVGIAIL